MNRDKVEKTIGILEFEVSDYVDLVSREMDFHNWTSAMKYLKLAERYDNARYVLESKLEEK